jgi:AcrR family transcriptional regulator
MEKITQSKTGRNRALVWIASALDTIVEDGPEALRVERLARRIGMSKGSYYWLFKDLDDLKHQVLAYWQSEFNDPIFEQIKALEGDARSKLNSLIEVICQGRAGRYDAALRSWALRDPVVAYIVSDVDNTRLQFLTGILEDEGDNSAAFKAEIFYRGLVAESYVSSGGASPDKTVFLKELARHLTQEHSL